MPAADVASILGGEELTEPSTCEAHLMHACDADWGDVWQCDLEPGHSDREGRPTRHHTWAGLTGAASGDGFDADCVEILWHSEDEALLAGPH